MVKILDVATAAGVSAATVSRALNGNPRVDPVLADRVREAALSLGYQPNATARNLRQQRTSIWTLIISDIENPFFTSVARGVEDLAQKNGFSVTLCNTDEDPVKEARYIGVAEQEQAAGVILSPHSNATKIDGLLAAGIPVVTIDRLLDLVVDSVAVNSQEGARLATSHLLDEGWVRPACITGPSDALTAIERARGYIAALVTRGMGSQSMVEHREFRTDGGQDAAAQLLDGLDPPDSFFVANSKLALGVVAEASRRGLRIGHDLGLIAFDDAPWAPFIDPPMSVVAQPAYDIGSRAATLLVERIGGRAVAVAEVLQTQIVIRTSSRRTAN